MEAGAKAQLRLAGTPAHDSEIGALYGPACAVAVTVNPPDVPGEMVRVPGAALNATVDKLGGGGGATATTQVAL
jgi:hypothetical protein